MSHAQQSKDTRISHILAHTMLIDHSKDLWCYHLEGFGHV
jgi:hypothetical protein